MNCARCGNALHRIPMFDLPRKVNEFSCLCCGERFWTTQGESKVSEVEHSRDNKDPGTPILEISPSAHLN